MKLSKASLARLQASNVTPFPTPITPVKAPQPQPAKETPRSDGGAEAMRAIAEALKEQVARAPEPMTFKFDIVRGDDGRIASITATPVKGAKT